ncbi:hypothetical protein QOZ80_3AG0239300 [Eleusine coracana subsp. coracana]|nr:hypothetical protein QOZ80_3AG0239300 [Eleusine coracana subsp. coracana]
MVATRVASAVAALLMLVMQLASAKSGSLPGCQATCGGVDIPYPFGIGPKCFRPGFEIACNRSTPYLAGTPYKVLNLSLTPSGARVELPIAWACYDVSGGRGRRSSESEAPVKFNPHGVYRISDARNQLYVIGCDNTAYIQSQKDDSIYGYEYYTGCVSYCRRPESVRNGSCAGVGCCRVDIPPNLTDNSVGVDTDDEESLAVRATIYDFSPCSYGFLVDWDSYTFRSADLKMDKKQMMPVWLDWAIRPNGVSNCSDAKKDSSQYACKSRHSICLDVVESPGYTCNCSRGYEGNAYVVDGCTDIDECLHPEKYPCYGVCHNKAGFYDCKCKRGSHGDPLRQPCDPDFSPAAKISVGVISGISCLIALSIFIFMVHEKRKLRASFERNGGPLLASINNIKIFTKKELVHITGNYSTVLGTGSMGDVYMGSINGNQMVAVKRSRKEVSEERKTEFANEIRIQSQISHKNVIRLLGCCLEVDLPELVYQYASKGSLYNVLHGTADNAKVSLSLASRLDIAVYTAEALSYMHSSATEKILHGDVKSGNILLDENFMPKVSDFGTSKLLSMEKGNIFVVGDLSYIDPACKDGRLDEKSDVYGYGVVLLELITRKKPWYDGYNSLKTNFSASFATEEKARGMYDEEIASPETIEFLQKVGSVAIACLQEKMDDRPNMKQVAEHLQKVRREWKNKQLDEASGTTPSAGGEVVDDILMENSC